MRRIDLPNRRHSETLEFVQDGHRYTATVGFDRHGRPQEVFLGSGKSGTGLETACRDAAVAVSLALQHGTPVETLRRAMARLDDGGPAGPLGLLMDTICVHVLEVRS